MKTPIRIAVLASTLIGCSGGVDHGAATGSGGGSSHASGSTSASNGTGTTGSGSTSTSTGSGGVVSPEMLGTYIALGDSISDGGGTGPFFYDLLLSDLKAKNPNIKYVHGAQAGAITDSYSDTGAGTPLLKAQIAALGSSYPGDVLVTITIGGNDLTSHAVQAIGGNDAALLMQFAQHFDDELGELTKPGRLGTGKVHVVLANIYDFTDGQGDFQTVNCGPPFNVGMQADTAGFMHWNAVPAAEAPKFGVTLYDMHADFMGHGYNNKDATQVWYDSASCIHPNAAGQQAIRHSIYKVVTGQALP